MKELTLYKFIENNKVEYHRKNRTNETLDVIVFIDFDLLSKFQSIIGTGIFDDGGLEVVMKEGYVAIWMDAICEYLDIDLSAVFDKEDSI